jgi:hypothetical protein
MEEKCNSSKMATNHPPYVGGQKVAAASEDMVTVYNIPLISHAGVGNRQAKGQFNFTDALVAFQLPPGLPSLPT